MEPRIEPHKITKPIQLLAVWLAALVLLFGAFLAGSRLVADPPWLRPVFGIAAVAIVPSFMLLIFVMQTRYRSELQDDSYYAEFLRRQNEELRDFHPENISKGSSRNSHTETKDETWEERERRRIIKYQENRGLFLVHTWLPSRTPGQVADIAVSLHQHGDGPLNEGRVKSVEYHLGPKFFNHAVIKTNAKDNFRLDVSAYGPMLCLGRVNFTDGSRPLELDRYINF